MRSRVYVTARRLSVPAFARRTLLLWVCCCAPGGQEISIDCCTAGAQQLRRRSSKCEQPLSLSLTTSTQTRRYHTVMISAQCHTFTVNQQLRRRSSKCEQCRVDSWRRKLNTWINFYWQKFTSHSIELNTDVMLHAQLKLERVWNRTGTYGNETVFAVRGELEVISLFAQALNHNSNRQKNQRAPARDRLTGVNRAMNVSHVGECCWKLRGLCPRFQIELHDVAIAFIDKQHPNYNTLAPTML